MALLDLPGLAAAGQGALAIGEQQGVEGGSVTVAPEVPLIAVGGEVPAVPQMVPEVQRRGGTAVRHRKGLLHMEGPGLPVRPQAAVVEDPVGDIGVLLDLRDHQPRADGVEGAGGDEEHVSRLHGHLPQHLRQGAVGDAAGELLQADLPVKAIVERSAGLGIQHHPHLRLAVLTLMLQGVGVGGVDLDGEVLFGVNELDEHGEVLEGFAGGPQGFLPGLVQPGAEGHPPVGSVRQHGGAVGVAGEDPRLGERIQAALDAEIGFQPLASPDIVLAGGYELISRHSKHLPKQNFLCFPSVPIIRENRPFVNGINPGRRCNDNALQIIAILL